MTSICVKDKERGIREKKDGRKGKKERDRASAGENARTRTRARESEKKSEGESKISRGEEKSRIEMGSIRTCGGKRLSIAEQASKQASKPSQASYDMLIDEREEMGLKYGLL